MRRLVVAGLILTTLGCQAVPPAKGPKTLNFRVIHSGANARYQGSPRNITYVPFADAYQRLWAEMVGSEPAPAVDFEREGVLFLIAGQRPTGGFKIDVRGVTFDGDVLLVDAAVTPPPADSMVTQALTSPFAVIAIDKIDAKRVQWNNGPEPLNQPVTQ
jgi:hypothetical protein